MKLVAELFAQARAAVHSNGRNGVVLFFDEVDGLFAKRENSGKDGGEGLKIVGQLLIEMDGVEGNNDGVFVMAATNRPSDIDPAFLRRLQLLEYVGLPDAAACKSLLIRALGQHPHLLSESQLCDIASQANRRLLSGAEIEIAVRGVLMAQLTVLSTAHFVKNRWFDRSDGTWDDNVCILCHCACFATANCRLGGNVDVDFGWRKAARSAYSTTKPTFEIIGGMKKQLPPSSYASDGELTTRLVRVLAEHSKVVGGIVRRSSACVSPNKDNGAACQLGVDVKGLSHAERDALPLPELTCEMLSQAISKQVASTKQADLDAYRAFRTREKQ